MKGDDLYLRHIHQAVEKIEKYTKEISFDAFRQDDMRFDAVVRELEIIGEAAGKISENFREVHAEIPWSKMLGMRNRLIHEYFGVDDDIVWRTCTEDLPPLRSILHSILEE